MDRATFQERLLAVMERKDHWSWHRFTEGRVDPSRLHVHFEQEWATYVRDFPVLVGWAYVQCPVAEVRRDLAANLYEEETGGLVAGRPHPELFLEIPRALGMDLERFGAVHLLPGAWAYRAFLDEATRHRGWASAAAVTTLFLEGTRFDRGEVDPTAPRRPEPPLEDHPLVVHYGLPPEALALTRAHRTVEGGHRAAAWHGVLDHAAEEDRDEVVATLEEAVDLWLDYRSDVAEACGLVPD